MQLHKMQIISGLTMELSELVKKVEAEAQEIKNGSTSLKIIKEDGLIKEYQISKSMDFCDEDWEETK